MDIILLRHADEDEIETAMKGALTVRGTRQAQRIAEWLGRHGPKHLRVLSSPALAARQTAAALGRPVDFVNSLGPNAQASDLLAAAQWPDGGGKRNGAVVIVGHQPGLGALASLLLSGSDQAMSMKKASLWWFSRRKRAHEHAPGQQSVLRAVITPEFASA
jgi:phosphohistidine phosphatase